MPISLVRFMNLTKHRKVVSVVKQQMVLRWHWPDCNRWTFRTFLCRTAIQSDRLLHNKKRTCLCHYNKENLSPMCVWCFKYNILFDWLIDSIWTNSITGSNNDYTLYSEHKDQCYLLCFQISTPCFNHLHTPCVT